MKGIYFKNGLILGLILVVIATILHAIDPRFYLNWSAMIGYAVILYFMYKTAVDVRKADDGILTFGDAFIAALMPMVIGVLVSSFYEYALHNWINPDLTLIVKEIAEEAMVMVAEKMSAFLDIEVDMDEALAELEKIDYKFSIPKMFLGWILTSLMGCVPALIIAAITKKKG